MHIFYVHGFNSSAKSSKVDELQSIVSFEFLVMIKVFEMIVKSIIKGVEEVGS